MKKAFHIFLVLGLATVLLAWTAGPTLFSPNQTLSQITGDGLKGYYIPAYQIKYGEGIHFNGLNYPYGEHIFFTDCHPALVFALTLVDRNIFPVEGHIAGIINFLKYANFILCALFLFLILRHFALPAWYAIPVALMITFLSPQLERTMSHYSLSYACFFPMTWYLVILWFKWNRPFLVGGLLFLLLSISGLIHLYHLPLEVMFILGFSAFFILFQWKKPGFSLKPTILLSCLAISALVFIQLLSTLTDPVIGRASYPFGFFHYTTFLGSVFLPPNGPIYDLANVFIHKLTTRFESQVFIGLVAVCFCFSAIVLTIRSLIRNRSFAGFPSVNNPFLSAALWSAVLALIFSMALPFRWGMEFLLDWFPFIRQFRSPARFAWIFYYVIGIYAAYYFFLVLRKERMKGRGTIFISGIVLIFFAWGFDVFVHVERHRLVRSNPYPNSYFQKNQDEFQKLLLDSGFSQSDFQAILPLPFISGGSQKFEFMQGAYAFSSSIKCSYETGLPIVGGVLSRSSVIDVMKILQIFNPPFVSKAILEDLPSDKPFLVIKTREPMNPYEERLLKKCKLIVETGAFTLFSLNPYDLNDPESVFELYNERRSTLFAKKDCLVSDSLAIIIRDDFEQAFQDSVFAFSGSHSVYKKSGIIELYNGTFPDWTEPVEMEASVWIYADLDMFLFPKLKLVQFNAIGNKISDKATDPYRVPENSNGWVRAATTFILNSPKDSIHLFLEGNLIRADALLIRPLNTNVIFEPESENFFQFNNYKLPK